MDSQSIRQHWTNWATSYGANLRATTKTWTAKALEVDALARRLRDTVDPTSDCQILEVGAGNGVNCIELAKRFLHLRFDGVDYIPEMVAAAQDNARKNGVEKRVHFFEGDILYINDNRNLADSYDVVFTDRCLINLDTITKQKKAIHEIAQKIRPGGHLVMIENSLTTYAQQNRLRETLGLMARSPAEYNLFFNEEEILPHIAACGLQLMDIEDFSSLHDLMLYVLVPAINGGTVDYEHPLVAAATKLSIESKGAMRSTFGQFGQNRMFVCRK